MQQDLLIFPEISSEENVIVGRNALESQISDHPRQKA